jgi:hypothetical protein
MSNNKEIAHTYAKQMAAMTNKVWISDNLPTLGRKERREILEIYKKYFKVVEYDSVSGVCKCWVTEPEVLGSSDTFGVFDSVNIPNQVRGAAIKQSTLDSIGADTGNTVHAGTVVSNVA